MTQSPTATLPARASASSAPPVARASAARAVTQAPAAAVQALAFAEPMPGFPGYRDYVLIPADPSGRVYWLQSVAPDGPRFLAVPAAPYFPDYAPTVPPAVRAELGLAGASDADLFCVVTVPDGDVAAATANLRAPVVVNPTTQQARQVVLADGALPIRRPLRR
jgi:flagellar assembly factor FliW